MNTFKAYLIAILSVAIHVLGDDIARIINEQFTVIAAPQAHGSIRVTARKVVRR